MKRAEVLQALVQAAEQSPESPRITRALRAARKAIARDPNLATKQDVSLALANTARALDCLADGLRWAGELRAQDKSPSKILPVLVEQNRKAAKLLEL
jgi:selenocysteine lyase/cysteine desulfurase